MGSYGEEKVIFGICKKFEGLVLVNYNNNLTWCVPVDSEHWAEGGVEKLFNSEGKEGFIVSHMNSNDGVVEIKVDDQPVFNVQDRTQGFTIPYYK